MMKLLIKKVVPKSLLALYHKFFAVAANIYYGRPSEKLIVIGVTGTNGKSTTTRLIADILKSVGKKVGLTSTVEFEIAGKQWLNDKKMTMLGRFELQKMIAQMVKAGCQYAIIETSSEGIAQYRHLGINYDVVLFTNLTPEHIEAHGGFENYRKAKGKLFEHLTEMPRKILGRRGSGTSPTKNEVEKISIVNLDDEYADYFLQFKADKKYGYTIKTKYDIKGVFEIRAENIEITSEGSKFSVQGKPFSCPMLGEFNIYNSLAAIAAALALGIDISKIQLAVSKLKGVPGRLEFIKAGQDFTVIIDQAPEPESLRQVYKTIQIISPLYQRGEEGSRIIHVLGSCGGGRDKARRPILGEISAKNSDYVIITNEDPYDEDPQAIIDQVAQGAILAGKELDKNLFKILDRREAIRKALELANFKELNSEASEFNSLNTVVLITGKGAEQAIAVANGRKIPWDDRVVAREELVKL